MMSKSGVSLRSRSAKRPSCRVARGLVAVGLAVFPAAVRAADAPAPAPPLVLSQAKPELAGYNVLILAFDQSALTNPIPGADAPPPASAIKPEAATVGGITPASTVTNRVEWTALAAPRNPRDDDRFRLEPDRGAAPPIQTPAAAPAPTVVIGPRPVDPPGQAQLAALPLRKALLNLGFGDVMPTAPDGTSMVRALGSRRLTPRVLDSLRQALARIVVAPGKPSPGDVALGIQSAARVGQSLGYRAVLALAVKPNAEGASFTVLLVDAMSETGEPILFDEKGADEQAWREAGGVTGAALIERAVRLWPTIATADRSALAARHLEVARAAFNRGDTATAQDELNQTIALDPMRGDNYVLLGDLLQNSDPAAAAAAYRRAVDLNARDGQTWVKIAQNFVTVKPADWARAIDAGNKALALGVDTAALRIAMATAQYGRADLFRKADRPDRAEDAEFNARQHLDRALQLAPDDPTAVRLLTKQLITEAHYDEAAQTLDRVAPMYPKDAEIQMQYATALARIEGREEDAFVAWAKVWKLSGQKTVDVDAPTYRRLAEGFDARIYAIGKSSTQLTTAVANAALPRESALLQLVKLKEDMELADGAINRMRPPFSIANDVRDARIFASDLMTQSLENHQMYLETTQDISRVRGLELFRQAVAQLNQARGK